MANRGACLHDGTLSVSRFDFGKRPGAPAERQVAFTPVQAAEADVVQAAAAQTVEKSLGLLYLRDVRSRRVSFNVTLRALPTTTRKTAYESCRTVSSSRSDPDAGTRRFTRGQEIRRL